MGKKYPFGLGTPIKAKTVCVWGQVEQKHVCREMTTWEMDSGESCVRAMQGGRAWDENRVEACPRGPRRKQPPFFKCHVHRCLKVASLSLKDSYED